MNARGWIVAAVLFAWMASEALGCPNCKDGIAATDPEGLNIARGYFRQHPPHARDAVHARGLVRR